MKIKLSVLLELDCPEKESEEDSDYVELYRIKGKELMAETFEQSNLPYEGIEVEVLEVVVQ